MKAQSRAFNAATAARKRRAPLADGTIRKDNVNTSPPPTNAASTIESSLCPSNTGSSIQLSEPDAAAPCSTQTASASSTNVVLLAIIQALLGETLNPDSFSLAAYRAIATCRKAGVPDAEIDRVFNIILHQWRREKAANPLNGLF
jgi:hypothetical protein